MTGILIVSSVVIYAFIGMVAGILVSKSSWEACDLIAGMFWPVALPVMAVFYVGLRMFGVAQDLVDLVLDWRTQPSALGLFQRQPPWRSSSEASRHRIAVRWQHRTEPPLLARMHGRLPVTR
jgi:ABC-type sugar transport system permease subunit